MSEPKVFWISEVPQNNIAGKPILRTATTERPDNPGWIPVIEKSAYDAVCKERDAAWEKNKCLHMDIEYLTKQLAAEKERADKLKERVLKWQAVAKHTEQERDRLRKALDRAKEILIAIVKGEGGDPRVNGLDEIEKLERKE